MNSEIFFDDKRIGKVILASNVVSKKDKLSIAMGGLIFELILLPKDDIFSYSEIITSSAVANKK